jgi:hypothetical protein
MRTKQLKFLEWLLLALFFTSFLSALNAQYIEVPLERKIQNAPFIFEGEVISSQSFMPEEQKIIYTSHIIKISKILKGDFPNDEVEIITLGGNVNGLGLKVTNNLMLRNGWEGIFFCKNTVRPSLNRSNSNLALRVYEGEQGFVRYQNQFRSTTAKTVFHSYENIETELLSVIEQKTRKRERINPSKRERALLEWISQKSYGNTSRNGMKTGIEYEFANPEITGQNDEYFEFDIEVSTFANTFLFGNSEIYLEYDPNVWGLDMVANGKITATKETVILSSDYSLTIGDETASKLKLAINSINNPNNPFSLTPNQEELCHLKLDISNLLSVSPSIFFDETSMQGESEYYQNGNFINFLNVVATDSMIQSWNAFVPPVIDSIRPRFINAGTFDTLYIYGNNFGQNTGDVFFSNADSLLGVPSFISSDDIHMDWSNNLIKVMMFSANFDYQTPGSGRIKVKNTSNEEAISSEILSIRYAIANFREENTGKAILPILVDNDDTDTFSFELDELISVNSDTANLIRKVLKQWRCKSGINWQLSNTGTNTPYGQNNTNTINFVSNVLAPSTLWATQIWYSDANQNWNYCNYNNQKYMYIDEVDMLINGGFNWFTTTDPNQFDTTKVDLWTAALHEFGHAHLLRHNNFSNPASPNIMYVNYTGQTIREIDYFSALGAVWIMDSIEIVSPHCGGDITRTYQGCLTSTQPIISEKAFKIYPNPTNEFTIIEFENSTNDNQYELSVFDVYGRLIYYEQINANYGQNIYQLNELSNWTKGIYFVDIRVGGEKLTSKVIKY